MSRRILTAVLVALLAPAAGALAGSDLGHASAAPAGSASQTYALVSTANGDYVSAEIDDGGDRAGMLRARSDTVGSWETFTLFTTDHGGTVALRSQANDRYVSAEVNDTGADAGMLRARSTSVGSWEKYTLVPEGSGAIALRSAANGKYVGAELNDTGSSAGMLRARSDTVGSWERFTLVALPRPAESAPTAPAPDPTDAVSVLSWNLCSNNSACSLYRATPSTLTNAVVSAATHDGFSAQVVFLQEFCEADAKPVELGLEAATGRGWDVRFAPIDYRVAGVEVQKRCVADSAGTDRGGYGVGLAVPDENVWYQRDALPSPPGKEQRAALCATVDSMAANFCVAHFSSGGAPSPGYDPDDPDNIYRPQQATTLNQAVAKGDFVSVFGGDLNVVPPDAPSDALDDLAPVYAEHQECDQSAYAGSRDGAPTHGSIKIDYIFGPADADYQCSVDATNTTSDHFPIYARITHLHAG